MIVHVQDQASAGARRDASCTPVVYMYAWAGTANQLSTETDQHAGWDSKYRIDHVTAEDMRLYILLLSSNEMH